MTLPPPIDWREAGIGPGPDVPRELRVTRDNWRTWPFMRWGYQHARELVPSRAVTRAEIPRALPIAAAPSIDWPALMFDDGEGGRIGWPEFLERTYTDAMIVLHRGSILFEHYANGMTAAKPHMVFSVTKSIVGLAAERLIAAGQLDPLARVGDVVPELAHGAFAPATLRHLLDMTDGASFEEDYANADAQVHRYSAAYWTPAAGNGGVLPALAAFAERAGAPGESFRYRTAAADMFGVALRRATGKGLAEHVGEQVWRPAGCADEAYMLVDTSGQEIAGTGFNATVRDLARLGLWLTEQRDLLNSLLAGGDRALFAAADSSGARAGGSYRGFWWIDHRLPATLAANGVFGQRLWIDPEHGLVVAKVGSHPVATNGFTEALHRSAFAALRERLAN
jgi:CubicO group peptidase (beta-lactamase class C family)